MNYFYPCRKVTFFDEKSTLLLSFSTIFYLNLISLLFELSAFFFGINDHWRTVFSRFFDQVFSLKQNVNPTLITIQTTFRKTKKKHYENKYKSRAWMQIMLSIRFVTLGEASERFIEFIVTSASRRLFQFSLVHVVLSLGRDVSAINELFMGTPSATVGENTKIVDTRESHRERLNPPSTSPGNPSRKRNNIDARTTRVLQEGAEGRWITYTRFFSTTPFSSLEIQQ